MHRRVHQADRHGLAGHDAEDLLEVALLHRQDLLERADVVPHRPFHAAEHVVEALFEALTLLVRRVLDLLADARRPRPRGSSRRPRRAASRAPTGRRSGWRNMCSARQSPMPFAPNSIALAASAGVVGVRAYLHARDLVRPAQVLVELGEDLRRHGRDGAQQHAPDRAVDRQHLLVVDGDAVDREDALRPRRTAIASHPATHGLPKPRATSAAWLLTCRRAR